MTFSSPGGLVLLATVPLSALLLFGRLRRRERPVAAFALLSDLVDSLPLLPSSFMRRRRFQVACFLMALVCAALAAGGPVLGAAGDRPQVAVLLIDHLAPRGREGDRADGWAATLAAAEQAARAFRADDHILLLRTDTGVVGGGPQSPRRAAALIARQKPSSLAANPAGSIDLLAVIDRAVAPALVGIVTVAPGRWRPLIAGRGEAWRILPAAAPTAANRALLDVEVRPALFRTERVDLFCRAGAFGRAGDSDTATTLTVSRDGVILAVRSFQLAPGKTHVEVFPALEAGTGLLRVELSPPDAFPEDDVYQTPLRERAAVQTLLVTEDNPSLEAALRAVPGLDVAVATPAAAAAGDGRAAVRIYDGVAPPSLAGGTLAITPPEGLPRLGYRGDAVAPRVLHADPTHFLLNGVSLGNLHVERLHVYEIPSGMEVLATADGHPLIAAGRTEGGDRLALLAFDPHRTPWVYDPSYPILIANLTAWLAEGVGSTRSSFVVGDTVPESLSRGVRVVRDPAGVAVDEPAGGWDEFRFPIAGRWRLEGSSPGSSGDVFVNLLDASVSAAFAVPAPETAGTQKPLEPRPFRLDGRASLLALALALLFLDRLVAPRLRAGRLP